MPRLSRLRDLERLNGLAAGYSFLIKYRVKKYCRDIAEIEGLYTNYLQNFWLRFVILPD